MAYNFFGRFPKIQFDNNAVTDITRRIKLIAFGKEAIVGFEKYFVQEGESPETIAFKFYGDSGYHWLIFVANDIINPYYDWPMTDNEVKKLVQKKYGAGHENDTHHWVPSSLSTLPEDTVLDATSVDIAYRQPVSNYEYETAENEKKREIRLIRKEFLNGLVQEFQDKIVI